MSTVTTHGFDLDLYQQIRRHIDPIGGADLPLPERDPMRDPVDLER